MKTKKVVCQSILADGLIFNNNNQETSYSDAIKNDYYVDNEITDNDGTNCPYNIKEDIE
ncbi:hypothetical protein LJC17_04135 [Acholeplasma sp. OttesenSCG-928-E16]|nr:hypothetical protein [Acholeplasma sp. OttesenSCG-928-E16]